jgi:phosphatidylserine/phosphatidylglycerophosphate/cardiolipin synthase-like enzyme
MPNIYDNSEDRIFLTRLEQNLTNSTHADVCVGYFNLHGYNLIADAISQYAGGESSQLRVIVGMSNSPHVEAKQHLRADDAPGTVSNEQIIARKKAAIELFADQFSFRTPNPSDARGLEQLKRDLITGKIVVKLFTKHQMHAKLYLTYGKDRTQNTPDVAFIGSSNFTAAGLHGQGELTVDNADPQNVSYLQSWYEEQWEQRSTVDITQELIEHGVTVKLAVGDTFGAETVMVLVAVPVAPLLSVTVSVTV